MCGTKENCHGTGHESCCCDGTQGHQEPKGTGSENREERIQYFRHKIECYQKRLEEAQAGLAEIERDG